MRSRTVIATKHDRMARLARPTTARPAQLTPELVVRMAAGVRKAPVGPLAAVVRVARNATIAAAVHRDSATATDHTARRSTERRAIFSPERHSAHARVRARDGA
jgi:hypothetical protein